MALFTRPSVSLRDQHFPGRVPIDSYGGGGFKFADMAHDGSLLCSPSGIYGWPVARFADIDEASLAPILDEAEPVDILIIGCGRDIAAVPKALRDHLKGAGIGVEAMATGPAIRTYNILLSEGRRVAAALIAV